MAKLLKLRRGSTSNHSSFTGAEGECTVDTDKDTLVVHDGSTAGGRPLLREDLNNLAAGAIAHAKLANDAVDGDNIADDSINSEHYADGSIDTAHIADAQVTHAKLANDCIDGDNIQDDVVNSEHIAAGAVDLEHMSSQSVDEDNLYISNAGTNGQFLQKQSGNNGGLTWADASTSSGGATGGGNDTVFWENGQTVTTNYTITNNTNAGSFGPITINSGVTVTIGSGENWTVI